MYFQRTRAARWLVILTEVRKFAHVSETNILLRSNVFAERWFVVEVDACAGSVLSFLLVYRIATAVTSTM